MATTTQVEWHSASQTESPRRVICHCTIAHSQLKSRTFHRQLLPLAAKGFEIRYLSPVASSTIIPGVRLIPIPRRKGVWGLLAFWPELLRKLLRQQADLYHFQDPQLLPLALALKLIFRKRVVYDAYEDFPSIAAAKRSLPSLLRPVAAALVGLTERTAARFCDAIITADPITLCRFARIRSSKKLVFYNFPNLDFFPAPLLGHPNFDLVYRGGISQRTGIFVLLEALGLLALDRRAPKLLLVGYFDNANDEKLLKRRIAGLGLGRCVQICSRIPHEEMARVLGRARIGVSPLLPIPKFQKNIPVKIFEYWACCIPVVATDLAPTRPFFRHGEAGLLVRPGSAQELAAAIAWLLDQPESAQRMGGRGRQLITERFSNAKEVQKLRRLFEFVTDPSQRRQSPSCSNLS